MSDEERERPRKAADAGSLDLWYRLAGLYSRAASTRGRSARLGFTVTLVAGALVLLSAPLFGTGWAGPFAPLIPVFLGLATGLGMYFSERTELRRREASLVAALGERGLDARRPGSRGLDAYYDAQLILLRSEYEYLLERDAGRSARLFEDSFGFTPEDPFETGPLNVRPDTERMAELRRRWERRMEMRRGTREAPSVGLREDVAYRFYPREMTVGTERVVREAYILISKRLIELRYGKGLTKQRFHEAPESVRRRIRRDLAEYEALFHPK
ncbi:Hypothetical Protein RradSPS_2272 [Rubrobacter radiotolerans]|uniref:Uncharacterized protein n=1 Tax=Rubrobacter radiotolerans TaxID=42256 RepID=A0A023X6F4_RUBRA|nr:hypothetical protein [Rubrobacter radiotolerans]AHY47555.1 Hypothetical Protein RradSPS_2272 [Rubrobacter radiotolerans]MDX5894960.1 hypothetical protein [Rubrobacter radiotolerans]SMC07150.1 conserved hypothetical protein [Rubrobacter radiotolerans DSM 5868]